LNADHWQKTSFALLIADRIKISRIIFDKLIIVNFSAMFVKNTAAIAKQLDARIMKELEFQDPTRSATTSRDLRRSQTTSARSLRPNETCSTMPDCAGCTGAR